MTAPISRQTEDGGLLTDTLPAAPARPPFHWQISERAATDIALEILAARLAVNGPIECSFAATWDPKSRTVTSARLMARGSSRRTFVVFADLKPGMLALHNHAGIERLEASDGDLDVARELAERGIGFGIINDDCSRLHLIREPRPTDEQLPTPKYRVRSWSLGPFTLFWSRPIGGDNAR
jgi:hypothetical protein